MEPIYTNTQDNNISSCDEFDTLFSNRSLRMLKLLTPFLPLYIQPMIAMIIRLQELQLAIKLLHKPAMTKSIFSAADHTENRSNSTEQLKTILDKISPLMSSDEQKELQKLRQMLQAFETYKQLEPYMSMFTDMASAFHTETDNSDPNGSVKDAETQNEDHGGIDIGNMMNLFSSGTPDIGMLSNLMQMFSGTSSDVLHQTDNAEQTNDS